MGQKYKIGFVILLSDELSNEVRDFQVYAAKEYGSTYCILNPPHITIKRPIEIDYIEKYEQIIQELADSTSTFIIKIQGYNLFADKTFFLDVIKSKELMNLHNNLLSLLKEQGIMPDNFEGDNQKFHISLANKDIPIKFVEIFKKEYLPKKQSYTFPLKELAILRYTGTHWVIHKKVLLK